MRPPGPATAAAPRPLPSPRITLVAWSAALLWAVALPELLGRVLPPGAAAAGAGAVLWSPALHTAAAAAFLTLMLLRQGRWYRPWQSSLLIALSALYLLGGAALLAAAQDHGTAAAR